MGRVSVLLFLVLVGLMPQSEFSQMTASKLTVRTVLPSDTDSRIDKFSGDGWEHSVYFNPSASDRKQLLVFIPGTGGKGTGAKDFCALAANDGFHVVELAYPSNISMSTFHNSNDPDAFQKARENVIYGTAPFKTLDTGETNSIQNRLIKLLNYLAATYPQENWQQFLVSKGNVDYSKLVLAGQSQGGGHAAFIAMQHEVARVLMFGSPKDFNVHFSQPAKWYSATNATPLNRYFSFVHSADDHNGCTYEQQLENYKALKLMPRYPIVNVDDTPAPYQHTRLLTSKIPTDNPHGSVIGNTGFRDAWKYMLDEPVQ